MNEIKTPIRAIRAKCLDCCCGQLVEVRECHIEKCPLHPYRMGKRPQTVQKAAEKAEEKQGSTESCEKKPGIRKKRA